MKKIKVLTGILLLTMSAYAQQHEIRSEDIASLQVVSGKDWLGDAVIRLGSSDRLTISFDDLTHQYRRYVYSLTHCNPDWTPTEGLFTSDFMTGFQDGITIDSYQESVNTNLLYTHYTLKVPNSSCSPKISGNYRLDIIDDDTKDTVITARFMVTENIANISTTILTDTDIDVRKAHQQVNLRIDYPSTLKVSNPREQFRVLVMQNHRSDNQVWCPPAPIVRPGTMEWTHCKELIFPAGNEFHKFEILNVQLNGMGVDRMLWVEPHRHAVLFPVQPQHNYTYDQDANGSYIIRAYDDESPETQAEYLFVHFLLHTPRLAGGDVYVTGLWDDSFPNPQCLMTYDESVGCYECSVLLKQGYYNYQFRQLDGNGVGQTARTEGDFYQTENEYIVLVYHRPQGARYDALVGYSVVHTSNK